MRPSQILASIALVLAVVAAAKPIPPCTRAKVDMAGWRTERFNDRFSFRLPPAFKRDPKAKYIEGGRRWIDGSRDLHLVNGYWGETSFGKGESAAENYSECVDTLANTAFLLITSYTPRTRSYHAIVLDAASYHASGTRLRRMDTILSASSPNRADQRLFLAIFRTLRIDATTAWTK